MHINTGVYVIRPGAHNLITDVRGLRVGQARDDDIKTGVTVLVGDAPLTAGVHVMGGAPGTRETDLLAPDKTVQMVDALVLSGGSAFGLDAASGVADVLRDMGRGFPIGKHRVPIVPGAILFDLLNGGHKAWGDNPYKTLGARALTAANTTFALGSAGAGTGATTANLKGGLGSASAHIGDFTVGAIVAVNALGQTTVGDSAHFWAAPMEIGGEFGARGPAPIFNPAKPPHIKTAHVQQNTTIAIVATDAALNQAQATRLATAAHDGIARAIYPSHTPLDGDVVFAAATGQVPLRNPIEDTLWLCHAAGLCLARGIARGVFEATKTAGDIKPTYQDRFAAP